MSTFAGVKSPPWSADLVVQIAAAFVLLNTPQGTPRYVADTPVSGSYILGVLGLVGDVAEYGRGVDVLYEGRRLRR